MIGSALVQLLPSQFDLSIQKLAPVYQLSTRTDSQLMMMHLFFPQRFLLFSCKNHFPPRLFFPISGNAALTKTLTSPSTLGGHTLNAAARFMTYPKL